MFPKVKPKGTLKLRVIPANSKMVKAEKKTVCLMLAGLQICHGFKEHFLINVRNESSSCCFHGKLVGFVCPKELVSSTSNM